MAQAPVGINQPVKINGFKTDWTSLRGSWWGTGLTSSHLKSLNWDEMVTPTKPRGVHGIPLTRGLGFYTATASMEVTLECFNAMLSQFPNGYTAVQDNPQFSYKPYGSTAGNVFTVKWVEAYIIKESWAQSQGQGDGLWVKLDIDVRYVLKAGDDGVLKCLYPLDLDGTGIARVTG